MVVGNGGTLGVDVRVVGVDEVPDCCSNGEEVSISGTFVGAVG